MLRNGFSMSDSPEHQIVQTISKVGNSFQRTCKTICDNSFALPTYTFDFPMPVPIGWSNRLFRTVHTFAKTPSVGFEGLSTAKVRKSSITPRQILVNLRYVNHLREKHSPQRRQTECTSFTSLMAKFGNLKNFYANLMLRLSELECRARLDMKEHI
jgi:hypothetical protein